MSDNSDLRVQTISVLRQEFIALVVRAKFVLGFVMQYPKDPREMLPEQPPYSAAMIALGSFFFDNHTPVANNAKNRARHKQRELAIRGGKELCEAPKPIGFFPLKDGCLYLYGNAANHSDFDSIAFEAGRLTGNWPLTRFTWHTFLIDWAFRNRRISWVDVGSETVTYSLNLPRESVLALTSLGDTRALGGWEKDKIGQSNDASADTPLRKTWEPSPGYIGRKTILTHRRFQKNSKNPVATTIDGWVKSAARQSQPVVIEKDPANQENYYPETWILERIAMWNPRQSET